MSDLNSKYNRIVWVDIPVADLDRAVRFYSAVLGSEVSKQQTDGFAFGVFYHEEGNGGCLVVQKEAIARDRGILVYLNVNGRIRDAVAQVTRLGGQILEPIKEIGPHGFRAVVLDCEGNQLALHSQRDA